MREKIGSRNVEKRRGMSARRRTTIEGGKVNRIEILED